MIFAHLHRSCNISKYSITTIHYSYNLLRENPMLTLELCKRFDSHHTELLDDVMMTRTRVSLGYINIPQAEEIYERILAFQKPQLDKVLASNYGVYTKKPELIYRTQQLTEKSCDPSTAPGR